MEQTILQLLRESAVAALAAFAIWRLEQRDKEWRRDKDDTAAVRKQERQQLADLLAHSNEVLGKNTEAFQQNTEAFDELKTVLLRVNGKSGK